MSDYIAQSRARKAREAAEAAANKARKAQDDIDRLRREFQETVAQLTARIETLEGQVALYEEAYADPKSAAAETLAKKHGKGNTRQGAGAGLKFIDKPV